MLIFRCLAVQRLELAVQRALADAQARGQFGAAAAVVGDSLLQGSEL